MIKKNEENHNKIIQEQQELLKNKEETTKKKEEELSLDINKLNEEIQSKILIINQKDEQIKFDNEKNRRNNRR